MSAPSRVPRWRAPRLAALGRLDEDAATTIVVVALAVILALFDSGEHVALDLAAVALGGLALTQKRRFPIAVLAVCVALAVAAPALGGGIGPAVLVLDALYIVARHGPPVSVRVVHALAVVAVLAAFAVPLLLGEAPREAVFFCLQALAILGTPLWWASSVRQSAELARVQAERADDAERLLVLEREEAVRAERERMARDLHDVVAANLSAIAITSEAALAGNAASERETSALRAIRASALDGLDEMRSMILILRRGDEAAGAEELTAPPRLEQVAEIVAGAGLVHATLVGRVPRASAATEQALARVVAEAIANAERHSPGAEVEVRFDEDAAEVSVVVTSRGGTRVVDAPGTGNGLGLIRERAERLGGRLEAGPLPGEEGWRVAASVPKIEGQPMRRADQEEGSGR